MPPANLWFALEHDTVTLITHAALARSGNGFGEEFASFLQFNDMWSEASVQISVALLATLVSPADTLMPVVSRFCYTLNFQTFFVGFNKRLVHF